MENKLKIDPNYAYEKSFIIGGDTWPKTKCKVRPFGNDNLVINLTQVPNIFYRVMMRLFFGFKFKILKD